MDKILEYVELGLLSYFSLSTFILWCYYPDFGSFFWSITTMTICIVAGLTPIIPKMQQYLSIHFNFILEQIYRPCTLILLTLIHFPGFKQGNWYGFQWVFKGISVVLLLAFEIYRAVMDCVHFKRGPTQSTAQGIPYQPVPTYQPQVYEQNMNTDHLPPVAPQIPFVPEQ